ncbi:hypothetical protein AUJ14_00685 [Candidatus Micrarchaeota archaeon CG1_02_55_22]|nr:MAG: hypothetical protein AUJ14_00685 [Candidatus Micrarchaeota archaeon CG1_02_55_22]
MGLPEKITEIEAQLAKTQVNKATEHHVGMLKAKLARLKAELASPAKGGGGPSAGFDVKKSGNASVVFIGLPSVGKSTMLNALTGSKSKIAAYAFTTLTCIPGMLHYKGADIQLLDLPGIIAGAKTGRGRGKEVLAVARNADLILLIVDSFDPHYAAKLASELYGIGIRLDAEPPRMTLHRTDKGGLNIFFDKPNTKMTQKTFEAILNEYGYFSANVIVHEDISADQLIDFLVDTRRYIPSLIVLNKIDLLKKNVLAKLDLGDEFVGISAQKNRGIDELKEAIYRKLRLIRVYTKSRHEGVDDDVPLMVREGSTIEQACVGLHRDLAENFKYAFVWGPSAKFPGQRAGRDHKLKDGDTFYVRLK